LHYLVVSTPLYCGGKYMDNEKQFNQEQGKAMLNYELNSDSLSFNIGQGSADLDPMNSQSVEAYNATGSKYNNLNNLENKDYSCWNFWRDYHYPYVIRDSYPVYIKEQAEDKGKKAFEVIKMLQDKKLMTLKTVKDFIDAMDALIKTL